MHLAYLYESELDTRRINLDSLLTSGFNPIPPSFMNAPDYLPWHKLYCRLSGMSIDWSFPRMMQWEQWAAKGYNAADLHLVIAHIKKRIGQKRRFIESLAFRNVVGNTDRFAEDLAEARAENRGRVDPGKAAVLRATGRPVREHSHAQPAKEVVERLLADLRKAAE